MLSRAALHPAANLLLVAALVLIESVDDKTFLSVGYHLRVHPSRRAFAEREEIDCVEHIRLSHAVAADETINLRRQFKRCLAYVPIIDYRQLFQYHFVKFWHKVNLFQRKNEKKRL